MFERSIAGLRMAVVVGMAALAMTNSALGQRAGAAPQTTDAPRQRVLIRFLTTDDYPPFNSNDEDGVLTGLNVDLARDICQRLRLTCDIRTRPWSELLPALARGEADAVIAAHRVTPDALKLVAFTERYFQTPGRFAVRRDGPKFEATPQGLDGRQVAVVRGSPHEAYLAAFFRNTRLKPYETPELALQALLTSQVDAIFSDGLGLVFWVNGTSSKGCCTLRGGPYFEPRYFGDGIAIAVGKNDHQLRHLLNRALRQIRATGRLSELVDRYLPIRVY
ncbi:MAG: transporter substrate-binding domain-containing protein [Hyphomicrobiaceae bacterium]|nr:transporter substrate-binding domain-containing protein [Hyphomicrobiaceae bacterium]